MDNGSIANKPISRNKTATNRAKLEAAQTAIDVNPSVSVRQLAHKLEVSRDSAHNIMRRELALYPYKLHTVQKLVVGDHLKRHRFSLRMMGERVQDPAFEHNLFYVDEAHFHTHGTPNRQNFRVWAESNPNLSYEEPLHSDRVTVLIGIGFNGIVGPFFFKGSVNGSHYREMLAEDVIPVLREWPNFDQLIFVQDGAPAHWALETRALLDDAFDGRWIGRNSPYIPWPPRSPDLTPMDYFVWG